MQSAIDLPRGKSGFCVNQSISKKGAVNQVFEKAACVIPRLWHSKSVWPAIPEHGKNHSGHLSADMANRIHVMQSFGVFLFVIGSKHGIKLDGTGKCPPDGSAQI